MNIKTQLQMKQTQQLVMTPQLQQAIKLLQLSRLELAEMVCQEILENPALDETAPPESPNDISLDQQDVSTEEPARKEPEREEEINILSIPDNLKEWEAYLDSGQNLPYHVREEQERPSFEGLISRPDTLQEHLLWQLRMSKLSPEEFKAGSLIIGNLDENGYLRMDLDEALAPLGDNVLSVGEKMLNQVQQLDPPGVAARDLRECLLLQVRQLGIEGSLTELLIAEHLEEDRKSTRLNSSHTDISRMPSSA